VLFALYGILFLGGMVVMGISFNVAGLEAAVFILGLLMVMAAIAIPFSASAVELRGDKSN
jgi:hypothetical protein